MTRISQFRCPHCGNAYSKAGNTNKTRDGSASRRERKCERTSCSKGFVTYEVYAGDYAFLQAARKFMENYVGHHQVQAQTQVETEADQQDLPLSEMWKRKQG